MPASRAEEGRRTLRAPARRSRCRWYPPGVRSAFKAALFGLFIAPLLVSAEEGRAPHEGEADAARCRGETFALVPLEPSAVAPEGALEAESQLRMSLGGLSGVCLSTRAHSAARLRSVEGLRLPACADSACRARWARHFEAKWLVSGTVFGLGGARTVNLQLWSADGAIVQRTSYTFSPDRPPLETVGAMIREARVGHSLVADRSGHGLNGKSGGRTVGPVQWALGGAALLAVAAGGGFGNASAQTSKRLSTGASGCEGIREEYSRCFANEHTRGKRQALAANALYAAGAVLGAGAVLTFAVEWP